MAPKEELQKDEILVMKKEKKDCSLWKWIGYLFLGTIIPALVGFLLMRSDYFELPVESWEFMATLCTMVYFVVFHYFEAEVGSKNKKWEKFFDIVTILPMVLIGAFWLFLIHPPDFIAILITPEKNLHYRCLCGLGMMAIILFINIFLWLRWMRSYLKGDFNNNIEQQKALDRRIRAHINVWILDVPSLFSLIVVFMGTRFILTTTLHVELFTETTHLAIASTFYSGAAAFHMLLGNAVFSFIHSGRLHKVIAPHSEVNSLQPEERAKR